MATARDFIARNRPSATTIQLTGLKFDERPGRFAIQELGGGSPILLELRGGLLPEVGAAFPVEQRGSTYTPYGASEGFSTVTGITYGTTEMTCAWDAPFMRASEMRALNFSIELTPTGLLDAFVQLQRRGRECLVQVGPLVRRGVLEKVTPKPTRGHFVDPSTGEVGPAGVNLEVTLSWRWSGAGEPLVPPTLPVTGRDVAEQLGVADTSLAKGLAQAEDAFAPDVLTSLRDKIGRIRSVMDKLRRTVRGIGALAQAPAQVVNEVLAAARSLGNVLNDFDNAVGDTRDAYLAAGESARRTARALGPRPSALAKAQRAKGALRNGAQEAMAAVVDIFDAIAARKGRRVRVTPGQSLADVARREGGTADAWPEIATFNQLAGQVVPDGVTEVEIPESFYRTRGG